MLLVHQDSVSSSSKNNRILSAAVWSMIVLLPMCPSCAEQILNSKGDEVLKNFRQGYGEDESLTSLWNNTMVEVLYKLIHFKAIIHYIYCMALDTKWQCR